MEQGVRANSPSGRGQLAVIRKVARTASGAGCPCKQSIRKGAAGGDQEGGS